MSDFLIVNMKLLKWQAQQVSLIKIQKLISSTYQSPPRSVLKRDHVEFLGCFPIHAIVFDPTGPKWSRPFNKAQIFMFSLMRRQTWQSIKMQELTERDCQRQEVPQNTERPDFKTFLADNWELKLHVDTELTQWVKVLRAQTCWLGSIPRSHGERES